METLLHYVWLLPLIMAVSFLTILFFGKRMKYKGAEVGIAAVGVCLLLALGSGIAWIGHVNDAPNHQDATEQTAEHGTGLQGRVIRQEQDGLLLIVDRRRLGEQGRDDAIRALEAALARLREPEATGPGLS